jgi:hypothetical protein
VLGGVKFGPFVKMGGFARASNALPDLRTFGMTLEQSMAGQIDRFAQE